jgi:diguanylate cyclase (GGDEF)-like protein
MDLPAEHLTRLRALWDLALVDDTAQLDGVLREARTALRCDYVEVWDPLDKRRVAYGVDGAPPAPIGGGTLLRFVTPERTCLFFREDADNPRQEMLRSLGWSAIIAREVHSSDVTAVLILAWRDPRGGMGEVELKYVEFLANVVSRVVQLADKQREINDRMTIDPLSGLHNRVATLDHIGVMISSASRGGAGFAVLYVDLDGFKALNDTYGHAFGDKALSESARRMRAALRRHEIVGRIGGDEFAAVVTLGEHMDIDVIPSRLLHNIQKPMVFDGIEVSLSASIGIARYPEDGTTAETLLANADSAMYSAKRHGGGTYAFFGTPPPLAHERERESEPAVEREPERPARRVPEQQTPTTIRAVTERHANGGAHALEGQDEGPYLLCFQPIIDARTGRTVAAEALIRMLHPTRGLLLPGSFPGSIVNGSTRLPPHIDREVLESLVTGEKYRDTVRGVPVHINLTEPAHDLIDRYSPGEHAIAIELPESVVAGDPDNFAQFIARLRERGFGVGISNFGYTGLGLRFLADLPLDFVKIGEKLIPGKSYAVGSAAAARAAIKQAHHFGWSVIAENVEDETQREWLVANGVDALQGYYICSPLTQRDFGNWVQYRTAR